MYDPYMSGACPLRYFSNVRLRTVAQLRSPSGAVGAGGWPRWRKRAPRSGKSREGSKGSHLDFRGDGESSQYEGRLRGEEDGCEPEVVVVVRKRAAEEPSEPQSGWSSVVLDRRKEEVFEPGERVLVRVEKLEPR